MLLELQTKQQEKETGLPVYFLRPEIQSILKSFMMARPSSLDYYVCSMCAAVSAALGKRVNLWDGHHYNYSSLWFILIGESGSGKSHPMDLMMQPLEEQDSKDARIYRREMKSFKSGSDEDMPIKRQVILTDITPEGLYQKLVDNPNGCILFRDEIKGFFDDMGRYNKSGEESNYMSIWDGKSFPVDRRSSSIYVENPFLSMLGSIQPGTSLTEVITRKRLESGFAERILFAFPKSASYHYPDLELQSIYVDAWRHTIERIKKSSSVELKLSKEALNVYKTYFNEIADEQEASTNSYEKSMYSKLQIQVLRLSIIVHYLCSTTNGSAYEVPKSDIINEEEMKHSIEWIEYFEIQFRKVLQNVCAKEVKELDYGQSVRALWRHLEKNGISQNKYAEFLGLDKGNLSRLLNKKLQYNSTTPQQR